MGRQLKVWTIRFTFLLLSFLAINIAWVEWKSGYLGEHSFCSFPGGVPKEACKRIETFSGLNAYFFGGAGYRESSTSLRVTLYYPSLRSKPTLIERLQNLSLRDLREGEQRITVEGKWLGEPFAAKQFDHIVNVYVNALKVVPAPLQQYGLTRLGINNKPNEFGYEIFTLANGGKTAVLLCHLPWKATDGSWFQDTVCRVWSAWGDAYYIEYSFPRTQLVEWQEINDSILGLLNSFKD